MNDLMKHRSVLKMSSSEEEALVVALYRNRRRRRHNRSFWVHPYITNNVNKAAFVCARELQEHESRFKLFYRMSKNSFNILADAVRPLIEKTNTKFRDCVGVEERLLITLR